MKKSSLSFVATILLLVSYISCGPFNKVESTGTKLPAQESEKQHLVLQNLLNRENSEGFQELWVNGIEYPMENIEKILDTIDPNYTIEIKNDSVASKQLLILKTTL